MRMRKQPLWTALSLILVACGGAGASGTSSESSMPFASATPSQSAAAETDAGTSERLTPHPIGEGEANLGYRSPASNSPSTPASTTTRGRVPKTSLPATTSTRGSWELTERSAKKEIRHDPAE